MDLWGEKFLLAKGVGSKIYTPNFFDNQISIDIKIPDIFAYNLKNVTGTIESSSFYTNRKIFIERFQWIDQKHADYSCSHLIIHKNNYGFILKKNEIIEMKERVLFLGGNGSSNYFHWVIEILSKLIFFSKSSDLLENISYIVVHEKVKSTESFASSLKIIMDFYGINIPIKYLKKDASVIFRSLVYITTFNHVLFNIKGAYKEDYCYFSKENLVNLREIFLSYVEGGKVYFDDKFPELFFIKRGKGISDYNKRNYNEDEVFCLLDSYGIKAIYIEDYSFLEQINLFSNAKLIVAPSGAFLTNLIFCKKGTKVISWLPDSLNNFSVYSTIAMFFDLKMNFIYAKQKNSNQMHGEYYLDLTSLNKILNEFFGINDV